ncbi:hypothetical protein MRB53_039510 [Persea americana]|nr:hypothetical protein MRB53_039510 [Persea americana]
MSGFAALPAGAASSIKPFKAEIPEEKLKLMKDLIKLSPIAPPNFENSKNGRYYGIDRAWIEQAKQAWLQDFDWRKHEARFNSYPSFKTVTKDEKGNEVDIHFFALFSKKADAVPLAFIHGWPGSNCEFLDILDLLIKKYTPEDLPYHIIVPSLPGYAFSGALPIDVDYNVELAAGAIHDLMKRIGFSSGYLVQGGDLGSFTSRVIAAKYEECRGMHLNMMPPTPPKDPAELQNDEEAQKVFKVMKEALDVNYAFAYEQGTKSSTIGLALSASPLALLAWLGEKFLAWTDDDFSMEKILEGVSLYWLTDTYARCMYHNRGMGYPEENPKRANMGALTSGKSFQLPHVDKSCGYSMFAKEIVPVPKSWAEKTCNLIFFNEHGSGGHFAAMEKPKELLSDVEEYVKLAWTAK